jgi:hypothetical protein
MSLLVHEINQSLFLAKSKLKEWLPLYFATRKVLRHLHQRAIQMVAPNRYDKEHLAISLSKRSD